MKSPENINPYNDKESKTEQVEEMFDSIAPAYDFMNAAMSFGLHRYWRNCALKMLAGKQYSHILDVATGTGDVAFHLYERFAPQSLVGIDLSEGMLNIARRKLAQADEASRRSIRFEQGNCLDLQFDDSTFDLVTVAYGVRNFERLERGYSEMLRVLRPGGTLCVIELSVPKSPLLRWCYNLYSNHIIPAIGRIVSGDSHAYSYLPQSIAACPQREEMVALMERAGFTGCRYRSLTFGTLTIYIAQKSE